MHHHEQELIYLVGSLYSKAARLRALLDDLAADDAAQGELRLAHRSAEGEVVTLYVHIEGTALTIMPGEPHDDLRLDLSGSDIHLE